MKGILFPCIKYCSALICHCDIGHIRIRVHVNDIDSIKCIRNIFGKCQIRYAFELLNFCGHIAR